MKKIVNLKLEKSNSYEDCEHRLSATSRAFCEKHNTGSEWWEIIPEINYELLGEIKGRGDRLTSDVLFIEPLFLEYKINYQSLEEDWKKEIELFLLSKAEEIEKRDDKIFYKDYPLIIKNLPEEEILKKETFKCFKRKYTKPIEVYFQGELFEYFRAPKTQEFSFEKLPGQDNFKEFEKFIKNFYKIPDSWELIFPEGSENSPIHYWGEKCKAYIHEVDGFTFVEKEFVENFEKEQRKKTHDSFAKLLNEIIEAEDFEELDYVHKPDLIEKRVKSEGFNDLISLIEKAKEKFIQLRDKYFERQLERYIREAQEFLKCGLYIIDNIERPEAPYLVSNPDEVEIHDLKIKEILKEARKLFNTIENDIELISTKAGYFFAKKTDKVWSVRVPDNKKGLFIGKKGANIKSLSERFNKKIIAV